MAYRANEEEIQKNLAENDEAIKIKAQEQAAEGKSFELDRHGPGVVPEEQWQKHKEEAR